LSADPFNARSEGEDARGWTWEPSRSGLTFVRADRIGPPAESTNARLRQMKTIADRFTASVDPDGTFANPEQLRLLTTPIYRYSATEQGILDGALFAFAQGTNPEVLLLIEADATAPTAKVWRYGFARMSCFFLRVHQGGQFVITDAHMTFSVSSGRKTNDGNSFDRQAFNGGQFTRTATALCR
jgi:hypothetical protein